MMLWFVKTMRIGVVLPLMVLLGVVSALVLDGAISVPVIDIGSAFGMLPFTAVIPLLAVIGLGVVQSLASPLLAAAASRDHANLLIAFAVGAATLYAVSYFSALWFLGGGSDFAAPRNMLGYTALLFFGQALFGIKKAPAVPAFYLVVSTIFGRVRGEVQPWAWPVLPASGSDVLLACIALLVFSVFARNSARRFTERFYV